jgi:hypothetical protein
LKTRKGSCIQIFTELSKSYGDYLNKKHDIKTFLKKNSDILLCKIDKSKNVSFLDKIEYIKKLDSEFDTLFYEKLTKNSLLDNIKNFNKLIFTMKPYISYRYFYKIKPKHNIKKIYGIIKWKNDKPVRPIVSSINAITTRPEVYLLEIKKQFESNCTFSVKSSKDFKNWFLEKRSNFVDPDYEILIQNKP